MTKKHYIELAKDLKYNKEIMLTGSYQKLQQKSFDLGFSAALAVFMDALKRDNHNFDKERFLNAVYED